MKKMIRKAAALFTAVCMALVMANVASAPIPAAAASEGEFEYVIGNNIAHVLRYTGDGSAVTIPDRLGGYTVGVIGSEAFSDCTSLTSVVIPDSVTNINGSAFCNCINLKSVVIPDGTKELSVNAFAGCSSLTSIVLPDSLTTIGYGVFEGTGYYNDPKNWENGVLYIGNCLIAADNEKLPAKYSVRPGTKIIGSFAFSGCTSLTTLTLPDSLSVIGDNAFFGCSSLTSIVLSDSLSTIGGGAFSGCSNLTSITIPDSVTNIKGNAFRDCINLKSVVIPDGAKELGNNAFFGCSSLTSIVLPDSLTTISYKVFEGTGYYNDPENWENGVLYIGNCLIAADNEKLPAKYSVRPGTKIVSSYAFSKCTSLTTLTLPDSLSVIGAIAFSNCSNLTSITIPIPNSLSALGDGAFSNCSNLTSITIPDSVTKMGLRVFSGCDSLTMYGYAGSYAETYAKENGILFTVLPQQEDGGVVVQGIFPKDAVLDVGCLENTENTVIYEISLIQNGQEVQPEGSMTVKIPLPENMAGKQIAVYRMELDGSRTDMHAQVKDGYAVFATDHFSRYVLETDGSSLIIYGDVNGSDSITAEDSLMVLQNVVDLIKLDERQTAAADVNGQDGVTAEDALLILQKAVNLINRFPVEAQV